MNAIIVVKAIIASNNTTPKAPIVNAIYMFHITGTKIIMLNATGISAINLFTPFFNKAKVTKENTVGQRNR